MQIAIPTSTASLGTSWTLVPGTGEGAHEDVDEGVDGHDQGATMLEQVNGAPIDETTLIRDHFTLRLRPALDPGTDEGHRMRLASRKTGGGWPGAAGKLELLQGGIVVWSTSVPANANWTVDAWDIPPANVAGITDYANLRARVQTGALGTYAFRVSAVQLELPIIPDPVGLRLAPIAPAIAQGELGVLELVEVPGQVFDEFEIPGGVRAGVELDFEVLETIDFDPNVS